MAMIRSYNTDIRSRSNSRRLRLLWNSRYRWKPEHNSTATQPSLSGVSGKVYATRSGEMYMYKETEVIVMASNEERDILTMTVMTKGTGDEARRHRRWDPSLYQDV
jgi:hypothetical protein